MSERSDIPNELISRFVNDAPRELATLADGLTSLCAQAEASGSAAADPGNLQRTQELARAARKLKELTAASGFGEIGDLAHLIDAVFDEAATENCPLDAGSVETLTGTIRKLRELASAWIDPPTEAAKVVETDDVPTGVCAGLAFDDPELIGIFVETTAEAIDELNQSLLRLEEQPDDVDLLNELFRHAHNIKGATGAAGVDSLYHLTHDMETMLDRLRMRKLTLDEALANALFAAADRLRADISFIKEGRFAALSEDGIRDIFESWMSATPQPRSEPTTDSLTPTQMEIPNDVADSAKDRGSCRDGSTAVHITFPPNSVESSIQAYLIYNKLGEIGEVLRCEPDVDSLDGDSTIAEITYYIQTSTSTETIERVLGEYSVQSVYVTRDDERAEATPTTGSGPSTQDDPTSHESTPATPPPRTMETSGGRIMATKAAETIRVDLDRLDQLMNLGGELVINKARFVRIQTQLANAFSGQNVAYEIKDIAERLDRVLDDLAQLNPSAHDQRIVAEMCVNIRQLQHDFGAVDAAVSKVHESRGTMTDFSEALHSLTRVSEGIQKGIMETRMVSIGPLFQRFRRVVRDMAKTTGKNVELVLRGETTELDKRMIDELADPITHMVRNSVDHGIETPEERAATGKPTTATVVLNAYHRGRHICVEVRDDGKGVNIPKLKQRIIERELATPAQVEQMTDKEVAQYVFRPGLTTAEEVTELSGRGMGMDIVLNKIDKVNGTVEIDTDQGTGTVVTIKLPLTLAIITALVTRIGKSVYAIPLESVDEIISVPRDRIQYVRRQRVIHVRDRIIPVATFDTIFDTALGDRREDGLDDSEITFIIVAVQDERLALVVDELICQEDVVIKNLAANYRNVSGIAGASIMGDGAVSLILDVAAMMAMFADRTDHGPDETDPMPSDPMTPDTPPSKSETNAAVGV